METCYTIHDREPYAHAFIRAVSSLVYTVEFLLHEYELVVWDTLTIISKGDDIFFLWFLVRKSEDSIFPCIFDEVWDDIVKYLYIHALIHTRHRVRREEDICRLLVFLKLWKVLSEDIFCDFSKGESLYFDLFEYIMRERLIVHDASSDMRETLELRLQKVDCLCIELHDAILYPFEIALHCCDGCTDLMWEIWEEVGADFFLDRERLLEIIDRRDKWRKFIGPTIPDTCVAFAVDDVSDIFCDGSYRSKYRTYPEKITDKDE